jgi:hypothetical protein
MPSSISSFDARPVGKALGAVAATVLIAWIAVPSHLPFDAQPIPSMAALNELVIERYVDEHANKPIVILGSSILTTMPPVHCQPDTVAAIDLQGRSALSGLEAIRRIGARPQVVLIEVSTLLIPADAELLNAVFTPIYWRIRAAMPPLRHNRNWIVMLYRRQLYGRVSPQRAVELPRQTPAEWDRLMLPRMASYLTHTRLDEQVRGAVSALSSQVRFLQARGTRVVLYDPIDARIKRVSPAQELRAAIAQALPDVAFIDAPDDQFPIYRMDGMHFETASGLQVFNDLMQRAGVSFTPKCEVLPMAAAAP